MIDHVPFIPIYPKTEVFLLFDESMDKWNVIDHVRTTRSDRL
jgi:hypothetical protein